MMSERPGTGWGPALCFLVGGVLLAAGPTATLAAPARDDAPVKLAAKPRAVRDGQKVVITFAVSRPTDVEVAVLDRRGKVVRHLAAGVVGGRAPAAAPLKGGLAQRLVWDGQDDAGRPAAGRPLRVRVRAGLRPVLGRVIGDPGRLRGKIYGLATDGRGHLYVASGCVYSSAPVYSIKVFDRKGRYVRSVLPMPANLKLDALAEYGGAREVDGRVVPGNHHPLVPYVHQGGITAFLGNTVRRDLLWLVNTEGRICRVRTDGSAVQWISAPKTMRPSGGPMKWALSDDGKQLYITGWWDQRATRSDGKVDPRDGVIYKVDPATGRARQFVRIDVPKNSFWLTERNGWYHFKNWDRKNGCAAMHGMAVDRRGRLIVCDRVNQRLAVYDAAGKLVGQTKIDWPDLVALGGKDGSVYVSTRRIIDGYKAVNELRVVKLSSAIGGKVLAETTLRGVNAPAMAVDAASDPPVIWLSNVGKAGERLVRIEDRGKQLVVTGALNEDLPPAEAIVKVWADPQTNDVYVNNGWNALSKYDGLTGRGGPIGIKAIDMAVGPGGNLYLYGRKGWNEPIYRCDRNFKPVPFSATGKPTTTKSSAGREVYGRYGMGWSNKGMAVSRDGRIYVRSMYDWSKYFVAVFKPDGTAEKHDRVAGGIVGPVDGGSGGIKVDREGNIYLGTRGRPKGAPKGDKRAGCVVKVSPRGGGIVAVKGDRAGLQFDDYFFEGATAVYPGLSPRADRGCVCKEARFDLDPFGRLYVPDALQFCIRLYDNAGNLIARFGRYGNADSAGPGSLLPRPTIPLGWPMGCSINRTGHLYVADVLNQRIVRIDLRSDAEAVCAITK